MYNVAAMSSQAFTSLEAIYVLKLKKYVFFLVYFCYKHTKFDFSVCITNILIFFTGHIFLIQFLQQNNNNQSTSIVKPNYRWYCFKLWVTPKIIFLSIQDNFIYSCLCQYRHAILNFWIRESKLMFGGWIHFRK